MRIPSKKCYGSKEVCRHSTSKLSTIPPFSSFVSVQELTKRSTDVNFIASQALQRSQQQQQQPTNGEAEDEDGEMQDADADAMAALERQARAPVGFVAASSGPEGGNRPSTEQTVVATNPDALNIEMDED